MLPRKTFGYVHPKYSPPAFTVLLSAVVSLGAIGPDLELIASVINFGALIEFTFVNLSVIAYFVVKKKRYKTGRDYFKYLIMHIIRSFVTRIIYYYLYTDAFVSRMIRSTIMCF